MADIPFNCTAFGYQVAGSPANLAKIDLVTGESTILGNLGTAVNAIGYNVLDNFIYGIDSLGNLVRIDATPTLTNYGAVPNLPVIGYNVGTADLQGHLFIYTTNAANYYVIDIDTSSPTFGQLLDPTNNFALDVAPFGTALSTPMNISDWTYNPVDGQIYGIANSGTVVRLNPLTGTVTSLTTSGLPATVAAYGANFVDADGNIYAIENNSGLVYRITISGNAATGEVFSQSLASNQNDGTSCPLARVLIDFGDAPDTSPIQGPDNYTSLLANNGPRHQIINELFLGTGITAEMDALQNPTATGDVDDGYPLPLPILSVGATTYTFTETVTNNTGVNANLYAWIDFNKNGIFEGNEVFTTVVPTSASVQSIPITFNVPAGITPDHTFVRIRLTTDDLINQNTSPTAEDTRSIGPASDGEVEDYYLQIAVTTPTCPVPVSETINSNTTATGKITAVDPFNLPITYTVGTPPTNGTVVINPTTGDWVYTPNTNFVGVDTFSFVATNLNGEFCTTDVTITVTAVPPSCPIPQNVTILSNEIATGIVSATDPQGQPITYSIDTVPANGVATVNPTTGAWTYTPNAGFVGNNTFVIRATNSSGLSCTTTINIKVNPLPPNCPVPQTQGILVNTTATGTIISTDPQGQILTYSITTPPVNGTATVNSTTGVWSYTPNKDFIGTDTFTVTTTNQSGLSCTTQVTINVQKPDAQITKTASTQNVLVGDTFTYTINVKNTGNVPIQSSIITDALPPQLQVQTLQLNGNTITGDLAAGVNVGALAIGETKTLTVTVKVLGPLPSNPFKNVATGVFQAIIDPNQPPTSITRQDEDEIGVNIYNPKLTLIKSGNKTITAVGETVTYTVIARNDGNIALSNVIVNDLLAPELKFVNGSVKVDNISQPSASIISGINIGTLNVGQSKAITFDAEVISQGTGTINNVSTGTFQFQPNPNQPPMSGSSTSNKYTLIVKNPSLIVNKTADKAIALLGDIITYTVTLTNNGDTDALNVLFKDTLPNTVQFVEGSFTKNGSIINSVNLATGVNIGNIPVGETVTVTYKVKVVASSCTNTIVNSAYAVFGYSTSSGTINYTNSNTSSAEVALAIATFKQMNIQNYFEIPCQKPDMEQINVVTAEISVENCYSIETPIGTSIEGQQLTGYKMIVHGNIVFVIDYTADVPEQNVHSAHYCLPFSTFVILPSTFSSSCQSSVNVIVEDVYFNQLSNRCFFVNTTALVTIGIR